MNTCRELFLLYETMIKDRNYINPRHWDARDGIGQVPWNMEIEYRGFIKTMTPGEYRSLVPAGTSRPSKEFLKQAIQSGKTFGQPFLVTKWDEQNKILKVVDHEGRSRVDTIMELFPQEKIPVHIFVQGFRASDITPEMKLARLIPQSQ